MTTETQEWGIRSITPRKHWDDAYQIAKRRLEQQGCSDIYAISDEQEDGQIVLDVFGTAAVG